MIQERDHAARYQQQPEASGRTGSDGLVKLKPERKRSGGRKERRAQWATLRLDDGAALVSYFDVAGVKAPKGLKDSRTESAASGAQGHYLAFILLDPTNVGRQHRCAST
jgi:hypothetical protein